MDRWEALFDRASAYEVSDRAVSDTLQSNRDE